MKNHNNIEISFEWEPEEAQHVMPMVAALIQMAQQAASTPLQLPVDPLQQMRMQLPLMMQQMQLQIEQAKQSALLPAPQPAANPKGKP